MSNRELADDNPPDGTAMHYERALEALAARIRELEAELAECERRAREDRLIALDY